MRRVRQGYLHLGFFLLASSAFAQSFVQANAGAAAGSANTFSIPFSSSTIAGDCILVGFDFASSAAFSSISDSQGNVFSEAGVQLTSPGGAVSRVYYANKIKGGPDTLTVNLSAPSTYLEVYVVEYSNISQVDAQAGATGSGGAVSSGNTTTTVSGDLIFGFCIADSNCSAAAGFNTRSTLHSNLVEDMISAGPGTYSATGSAGSGWTMQMVALKAGGTGSSGTPANACDLATPFGTVDSADVQTAINMSLGVSPCTANISGPNVCNVVVVQRVINATLPSGSCVTGSTHQVSLTWVASTSSNVTYNVYRSSTSGVYTSPLATLIAGTSYTDSTVLPGQTYFYVVTAVSGGLESTRSNETQALVPTP